MDTRKIIAREWIYPKGGHMAILKNKDVKFGGKVADIQCRGFTCIVTTAKEGIFQKLSTMIYELVNGEVAPYLKIIYRSWLSDDDRREVHDRWVMALDGGGDEGFDFREIVHGFLKGLIDKEIIEDSTYIHS